MRHLLTTISDAPLASALFPLNTLGKLTVFGEKLTLKIAIFSFQIITLTVTKEEQLKDVWVVYRYSSSSNLSIGVLQVSVLNGNHISEVKRSVNCTASNIHRLQIQLSTRRHQNKTVITIIENETHISDLATWKKEVIQRTQRVLRKIIDLQRKCKRTCLFMEQGILNQPLILPRAAVLLLKREKNVFWPYLMLLGNLSKGAFERCTLTGSWHKQFKFCSVKPC